jgi:hypothetical protein
MRKKGPMTIQAVDKWDVYLELNLTLPLVQAWNDAVRHLWRPGADFVLLRRSEFLAAAPTERIRTLAESVIPNGAYVCLIDRGTV